MWRNGCLVIREQVTRQKQGECYHLGIYVLTVLTTIILTTIILTTTILQYVSIEYTYDQYKMIQPNCICRWDGMKNSCLPNTYILCCTVDTIHSTKTVYKDCMIEQLKSKCHRSIGWMICQPKFNSSVFFWTINLQTFRL